MDPVTGAVAIVGLQKVGAPAADVVEDFLERLLQQARNCIDSREAGLGDRFLASVEQTIERISKNADSYQIALLDLHLAPIRPFQYSLWYRILPNESVVVAALCDRRELSLPRRRAVERSEPL